MTTAMRITGRYFDQVEVGDRWETLARTVTEADVVAFAGISGDFNPLHTDAEFARDQRFGERIAHGLCGLTLLSGLIVRLGIWEETIVAFLGLRWGFKEPIKFGDTVRAELEIVRKRLTSRGDAGIVTYQVALVNQHDEVTQEGEWDIMLAQSAEAS